VVQCAYGTFERVVPLPAPVLADQANASYENGVLKIDLPKAHPGKAKRVEIKVG
jgi:HSP20 family protein